MKEIETLCFSVSISCSCAYTMNLSPVPSPSFPILLKVLAVVVLVSIVVLAVHGVAFVICWFWELNPDYVDLLAYVYHRVQQQVPELEVLQIGGEVDPHVRDNWQHTRMISFIYSRGPRLNLCSIILDLAYHDHFVFQYVNSVCISWFVG